METRAPYFVSASTGNAAKPLESGGGRDILALERAQLLDLERQLISSLVTVQRALGKKPTVITRAQRRATP